MKNKYRKKPVIIEAMLLTEENYVEVHDWIHDVDSSSIYGSVIGFINRERNEHNGLPIKTLEGVMVARIGDYVIKGVNGEFYPCKPDIFDKTYEEVK
jgi:hypothetical protein